MNFSMTEQEKDDLLIQVIAYHLMWTVSFNEDCII
jgi:hypothetical protein